MLPFLTQEIPGVGGVLRAQPEDFVVHEIPAYPPSGVGTHIFVQIEKRGLTTQLAIGMIARALGLRDRDIGCAGQKDRHAVTTQWLSLPPPATVERALAFSAENLRVLAAVPHAHKLRTGHLRGNAFMIRIRETTGAFADATRAFALLTAASGVPNFYGEQRFGAAGDNAARGREIVKRGDRRAPNARFMVSALQSAMFNEWLTRRMSDGVWRTALLGDIMHKVGGGLFDCADSRLDSTRVIAGEIVPTGPMLGHTMRAPTALSEAAVREDAVFAQFGLTATDFAPMGNLAEGTRRDAAVPISDAHLAADDQGLVAHFTLPAGAYATVVLRELMKTEIMEPMAPPEPGAA